MSTAVFAKTSEKNDAVKKTGIVTSLSLDAKEKHSFGDACARNSEDS